MDITELVDRISGNLSERVATSVETAHPGSYANQWWRALGSDARVNAHIVADHLDLVLPDDLRDFRRVVRSHSAVAPVNVIQENGQPSSALLYCIPEDGHDLDDVEYCHYLLGLDPVTPETTEASRLYGSLSGSFQRFYSLIHNGFAVDIEHDVGGIPTLENIATWRDRTGDSSPDDIRQSLLGDEPYAPDPNQMVIVFDGGGDLVFTVLDHSNDNWQYAGGSFFYYSEISRSGRRITPLVLIEMLILDSYLDYAMPMPFE
ncbi:hypothetical protein [Tsukamurella sp. PLM1]|uniref:hypothetical protein n=1 Tax=Tsukamurella sp. PLM1 TaxID=2929795 RepID=UPI002059146F|nr:hypothetical protein [Tsukamurella sp. PLM1]BDH56789.1 hypothetical protein MTP03_17280 [Tsukamurella sp. PLM1]